MTGDDVTRYEINIEPNEFGGYYAQIPEWPTIFTGGQTREEALRNGREAIALMIEEFEATDIKCPKPLPG